MRRSTLTAVMVTLSTFLGQPANAAPQVTLTGPSAVAYGGQASYTVTWSGLQPSPLLLYPVAVTSPGGSVSSGAFNQGSINTGGAASGSASLTYNAPVEHRLVYLRVENGFYGYLSNELTVTVGNGPPPPPPGTLRVAVRDEQNQLLTGEPVTVTGPGGTANAQTSGGYVEFTRSVGTHTVTVRSRSQTVNVASGLQTSVEFNFALDWASAATGFTTETLRWLGVVVVVLPLVLLLVGIGYGIIRRVLL